MMKKTKILSAVLILMATLGVPVTAPTIAQEVGACLSTAEAGNATMANQVLRLAEALQKAGIPRDTTIHNQQICMVNGQLAYVLDTLTSNGLAQKLILSATTGTRLN